MVWLEYFFTAVIVLSLLGSVLYSFRYRRQTDPAVRGVYAANMNMSMGVMLLAISFLQLMTFTMNSARLIIAVLFMLLGLFNLFAGIRNRSHYKGKRPDQS